MLHQLHQQQQQQQQRQRHDRRQLVRVAARTAAPIVIAVPKCANPRAPRTHPLEPAHGIAASGYLQPPLEAGQQQRRHHDLAADHRQRQEQVLLIVQDEHGKVPVIGRRLPAKSMPQPRPAHAQELYLHHHHHHQVDQGQDLDQEPVQGRRSHRLHQHHYRQLYAEQPSGPMDGRRQVVGRHQQLLVLQQANYPAPGGYPPGSQYNPSPGDYPARASLASNHQAGLLRPAKLHRHHPSSSCSSLCSAASTATADDLCPSCSPTASLAAVACCRPYGSPLGRAARSASCQRLEPAACLVAPNATRQKKPSGEALQVMVPVDYHQQPSPPRSHARNLLSHHHMCQANEDPRKSGYQRASSCHDERAKNQHQPLLISGRNLLPVCPKPAFMLQHQQPQAPTSRRHQPGPDKAPAAKEPQVEPQVSQMYESLAAELKAKLGDPRLGPILLPPKDYDTMSRRQGKLSGIELRRSTNPQLVGTAAVAGSTTTNKDRYVNSNKQSSSGVSSGDSARSSGRSQSDDKSLGSRSSSNSSSGLGSISMNLGGSSTSSPSSQSTSSEDMRCHRPHHDDVVSVAAASADRFAGAKMAIVGGVDEKQLAPRSPGRVAAIKIGSSPDNGTSSDSGHSESCVDGVDGQHLAKLSRDAGAHSSNDYVTKPNATSSAKQQQYQSPLASQNQFMAQPKANIDNNNQQQRGPGIQHHNPSKVSSGVLWNGRVEVPLKVNNDKNGHTYLATKQIIY